jgi:hypothetical protein
VPVPCHAARSTQRRRPLESPWPGLDLNPSEGSRAVSAACGVCVAVRCGLKEAPPLLRHTYNIPFLHCPFLLRVQQHSPALLGRQPRRRIYISCRSVVIWEFDLPLRYSHDTYTDTDRLAASSVYLRYHKEEAPSARRTDRRQRAPPRDSSSVPTHSLTTTTLLYYARTHARTHSTTATATAQLNHFTSPTPIHRHRNPSCAAHPVLRA